MVAFTLPWDTPDILQIGWSDPCCSHGASKGIALEPLESGTTRVTSYTKQVKPKFCDSHPQATWFFLLKQREHSHPQLYKPWRVVSSRLTWQKSDHVSIDYPMNTLDSHGWKSTWKSIGWNDISFLINIKKKKIGMWGCHLSKKPTFKNTFTPENWIQIFDHNISISQSSKRL